VSPVYFKADGESGNYGGKEICISTAIKKRKDFDQAVGLALHEAAHTVLSDFDLFKTVPFNAPKFIWDFGKKHNIRKATLERFLKTMINIIEDWFIDDWVISRVPGYLGYYEASYNVCSNTDIIESIVLNSPNQAAESVIKFKPVSEQIKDKEAVSNKNTKKIEDKDVKFTTEMQTARKKSGTGCEYKDMKTSTTNISDTFKK
jgi:hypothetical protein